MSKSLLGSYASRFLALGLVALLIQGAYAHTYLSSVVIGGTALAEGDCVRPHPTSGYDNPISLVSSTDMTCGFLPSAAQPANRACPITAGSQMSVQWHHNNDLSTDDILDPSHKGPILFYLAKSDTGAGNVWFKIFEDGYDAATGLWATDRMIARRGLSTFTIPADIAPGNYLLRGEVIALHQAYELNGVQPYVGCVELSITGSGTNNPAGVAFPGAYSDTDPGLLINIYNTFQVPYPFPGPAYYEGNSAEAENSGSSGASSATQTSGPTPAPSSSGSGYNQPTYPPTYPPTNPTNPPTNPTNPPTYPPTNPTSPPSTPAPSSSSSSGSSSGAAVYITLYPSANMWWFALTVNGASSVASIEVKDSSYYPNYILMSYAEWGYSVASQGQPFTAPLTVRITNEAGQQVTATVPAITPNSIIAASGSL